jgi:hypothetical protein
VATRRSSTVGDRHRKETVITVNARQDVERLFAWFVGQVAVRSSNVIVLGAREEASGASSTVWSV